QKEEKVEGNVEENIWMNVEEDIEVNIEGDVKANVKEDVKANVEKDAEMNVEVNVVINAEEDVEVNVVINAEKNVEMNVEKKAEYRKEEASKESTYKTYIKPKPYISRRIQSLAKYYLYHSSFPLSQHVDMTNSEVNDVDSSKFQEYVNDIILPEHIGETKKTISLQTAERKNALEHSHRSMLLSNARKNQEGFWTVNNLLEQIRDKVIPIFETKFPNIMAVFAFDNSTNHKAYAENTLIAARMNLKPGENQPKM
ncbi:6093_t:CDS:2, partial [Cetraspora pellucida]